MIRRLKGGVLEAGLAPADAVLGAAPTHCRGCCGQQVSDGRCLDRVLLLFLDFESAGGEEGGGIYHVMAAVLPKAIALLARNSRRCSDSGCSEQ